MAEKPGKKDDGAEKAFAAASAATPAKSGAKPVKRAAVRKPAVVQAKPKPAPKPAGQPAAPKAAAKVPAAAPPKLTPKAPEAEVATAAEAPVQTLTNDTPQSISKEPTMATQPATDFTNAMSSAMGEMQTRAKTAYDKSTEMVSEMTELAKGNVEAVVESGKIFAGGMQDMSKDYVEEAKSAYEQMTADMKEMAAVKSPTELFQLQGKIMRRNFDALVATGSKNTEAMMKLANDSFAPLSGRVNLAAEKFSKVA